ncbi:MAG TPA: helix-turn-helix transcriptional regulator [Candidatus Limnocylindrales bacterium]|jgi:DNA-binding CsgD family transcriptional regulator|nr:helix-turn-helix transcriptional regulator [Candidatus Limnocylindrales bacterium]
MAGSLEFVTQRPPRSHPSALLSPREREVLALALTGMTAGEIAEALVVTEATVRSHLARIYAKTGVRNRTELVLAFEGSPAASDGPAPNDRSPSAGGPPGQPSRRPVRGVWLVAGGFVALAVVLTLIAAVITAGPPSVPLSRISAAIDGGQVVELRLVGPDLTAITSAGERLHAAPVSEAQFAALDIAKVTTWSATPGSGTQPLTLIGMAATAVLPAIVVVVVLVFLIWFAGGRIGRSRPDGDSGRSVATGPATGPS